MTLHPLIVALTQAVTRADLVSWRSDLAVCTDLQSVKPRDRPALFTSALVTLTDREALTEPQAEALLSVLRTLMTVKSSRAYNKLVFTSDHVDALLDALWGDPYLPTWLLTRLASSLGASQAKGVAIPDFFTPYTRCDDGYTGTEDVRKMRPDYPHPAPSTAARPADKLDALVEEVEGLEAALEAHPRPTNPHGWNSSKAHAVAMHDWFASGPATRSTKQGVIGFEDWGWWRIGPFQLALWGTTLQPALQLWFATLDPSTSWPPAKSTSRGAPTPNSKHRPHIALPLFALMGPKHGPDTPWSTKEPGAFLDPWWQQDVVPWMDGVSTLVPLPRREHQGVPFTMWVNDTVVQQALTALG